MNLLHISLFGAALLTTACNTTDNVSACNEITNGSAFKAAIDDPWCLNGDELRITAKELIDDSRCNPTDAKIQCFWEGQVVLAVDFEYLNETQRDTFVARYGMQDTLQVGIYDVRLVTTYPQMRDFNDLPVDPDDYQFELVVD